MLKGTIIEKWIWLTTDVCYAELNISLLVLVFLILFVFHVDRKYFLEITQTKWMKKFGTSNWNSFLVPLWKERKYFKLVWRFFQAFLPVYEKKTYFVHNLYEINNNLGQCKYS